MKFRWTRISTGYYQVKKYPYEARIQNKSRNVWLVWVTLFNVRVLSSNQSFKKDAKAMAEECIERNILRSKKS